jgi:type VI secretion system secreted protein VgrG
MSASGTQFLMTMTTPLGGTTLVPVSLNGTEMISAPFAFTVEMVSATAPADIDPNALLFKPICVTLSNPGNSPRYFHGLCRAFASGGFRGASYAYRAEVVPQLWFAGQTSDCRVFHNKTAKDIITTVLSENSVTPTFTAAAGPTREYTVQYNETDLQFITRLMEEDGYYYYFQHSSSAHTMVIVDTTPSTAIAHPTMQVRDGSAGLDGILRWEEVAKTAHGKYQLDQYDPLNPATIVTGTRSTGAKASGADSRDIYHWPEFTVKNDVATARAKRRQEAADAYTTLYSGVSGNAEFIPGSKFTLVKVIEDFGDAGDYVIRSVSHTAVCEAQGTGGTINIYRNTFTAFPAAVVWREPMNTRRPQMAGIFHAVVLGDSGEEIHVDENYRIQVRFFWDHRQDATADNTIPVRIMQPWSGNGWGWQHIPRVGSEVAIAFIDGDPDHPICVGSLYNGQQKVPFTLPAKKTISGIRTRSTTGGGTSNYSEFSFDDTMGSELVFLHAEKDHSVEVENDQTVHVMHDQKITVDNNRTKTVKVDETVEIDGKQTITVTKDRSLTVSQGNMSTTVSQGNQSTTVSQGNQSLTVSMGNITTEASMGNISTTADIGNITTEASLGNISIKADVGQVTIEALQGITLKVGSNSIKIDMTGVAISGLMFKADGQIQSQVSGLMTQISGSAMTQISGAITMIG